MRTSRPLLTGAICLLMAGALPVCAVAQDGDVTVVTSDSPGDVTVIREVYATGRAPDEATELKLFIYLAPGSEAAPMVVDAGGVVASEWRSRVPVLDAHYQTSLDAAPRAGKTKAGASGSVAPRKVAGVPDDEQPVLCAGRLEFGDTDRAAEPSARPAFDMTRERAVEAAADVLERALAG